MPIPDYQECMLPMLEVLGDGKEHRFRDVIALIADRFKLNDDQRNELLPSGRQSVIANRVGWAKTYLKKAGLVSYPQRGNLLITPTGLSILGSKPKFLDNSYLRKFASFNDFIGDTEQDASPTDSPEAIVKGKTPDEQIEFSFNELDTALADELLDVIKRNKPEFFERMVLDLLKKMKYGGYQPDSDQHVGRSGDGGIDGIIKEDELGLSEIAVQAKRWEGSVGRPVVQGFVGSMEGYGARKGVLITTSTFTRDAIDYVETIDRKVVLIDGKKLTRLMVEHGVGVETIQTYKIKRLDKDYFDEDDE